MNPYWIMRNTAQSTDINRSAQNQADERGLDQDIYVTERVAEDLGLDKPYTWMRANSGEYVVYYKTITPNPKRLKAGR